MQVASKTSPTPSENSNSLEPRSPYRGVGLQGAKLSQDWANALGVAPPDKNQSTNLFPNPEPDFEVWVR